MYCLRSIVKFSTHPAREKIKDVEGLKENLNSKILYRFYNNAYLNTKNVDVMTQEEEYEGIKKLLEVIEKSKGQGKRIMSL